jgi:hypothetical protein
MTDCKPISTPIEEGIIEPSKLNEKRTDKKEYQSMIGSLLFAAIGTRPDIAYAVNVLSQFSADPSQRHEKLLVGFLVKE